MNANVGNWLQLYVDAVMERDPYKRLALVRKLKNTPKDDLSDNPTLHERAVNQQIKDEIERPKVTRPRKSKPTRRQ